MCRRKVERLRALLGLGRTIDYASQYGPSWLTIWSKLWNKCFHAIIKKITE